MSDDHINTTQPGATDKPSEPAMSTPGRRPAYWEWPKELGGQKGPEPTRYGDWEQKGRCTDF